MKFVFVTGGVLSSIGKGIVAASIGTLLEAGKVKISLVKCDPYLNVDPGTLSPLQHGEVFVTEDGFETDLDLGHYERFTSVTLKRKNSITTGQIYKTVLEKERKGVYKGSTVQVIPHVVDEIKVRLKHLAKRVDVLIVEIGGTIGDLEGQHFIEAIRQLGVEVKSKSFFIHVTYVPFLESVGELKSKPTQHSVKTLRELGIQPDVLICRTQKTLTSSFKKKIGLFCNLHQEFVIEGRDVDYVYEVPLKLHKENLDKLIMKGLNIKKVASFSSLNRWRHMVYRMKHPKKQLDVGIVGKYIKLVESYKSIIEALSHGGLANQAKVNIHYIQSDESFMKAKEKLQKMSALIIPGGFGERGSEGKLKAIEWARESGCPLLGICFGMQLMAIEFARHVCGLKQATSRELKPRTQHAVIDFLENQSDKVQTGGTMRLGAQLCTLERDSKISGIYKKRCIFERHRHRLEFNNQYKDLLSRKGMLFSGKGKSHNISVMETIELKDHPWFIGVQFHPELQSRPLKPHPLFVSLVKAGLKYMNSR